MEVRSLLQDLDDAVSRGSAESRLRALWHTTDLLIAGRYTEDQIWTFGEVIERLANEIEVAARVQLAKRLARTDNAPINVINKLAFHDSIDVAGPIRSFGIPSGSTFEPWLPTLEPKASHIFWLYPKENPSPSR
jgi:uncharacterized protein (DUF2336 family)